MAQQYYREDDDGNLIVNAQCQVTDDKELYCETKEGHPVESVDSVENHFEDDYSLRTCEDLAERFIDLDQKFDKMDPDEIDFQDPGEIQAWMAYRGMASTLEHGCPAFTTDP